MSPAEEMRKAATTLRERVAAFRAEAKTNSYWADMDFAAGVNNAMGGAGGELAALLTPELAEAYAEVLDEVAQKFDDEVELIDAESHGRGCDCGGAYVSDLQHDGCGRWLYPRCVATKPGCRCFASLLAVARTITAPLPPSS